MGMFRATPNRYAEILYSETKVFVANSLSDSIQKFKTYLIKNQVQIASDHCLPESEYEKVLEYFEKRKDSYAIDLSIRLGDDHKAETLKAIWGESLKTNNRQF